MIKYFCDKCGKEITDIPYELTYRDCCKPRKYSEPEIVHLCSDCISEFFLWVDKVKRLEK